MLDDAIGEDIVLRGCGFLYIRRMMFMVRWSRATFNIFAAECQ